MLALADVYSSGESRFLSSWYSFSQFVFVLSKASARPPHPAYLDKTSCSPGVAVRFSISIFFNVCIASIFWRYFSFGAKPFPAGSSSLYFIWKLAAFVCPVSVSGSACFSCIWLLCTVSPASFTSCVFSAVCSCLYCI